MWGIWEFLYCPFIQTFQWKWRHRGQVELMESTSEENNFSESLTPNYPLIKTARGAVSKNCAKQPQFFENVTLVAHRRKHFRGFLAIFFGCSTPSKRGVLVHKNSVASCQRRLNGIVTASSHAL